MIELGIAALMLIGAIGSGSLISRKLKVRYSNTLERICFSTALGLGGVILAALALGLGHLLYSWVLSALVVIWVGIGAKELIPALATIRAWIRSTRLNVRSVEAWVFVLAVVGFAFGLLRAMAPPHGSTDPLAYQLALPRIFLAKHYLSFEPTITGALYPTNMGLLYVLALAVRDGTVAQIWHWLMGVLTCVAIAGFCFRYLSKGAGIWAAAIFSFTPVLVVFGPMGYVDLALCFFQFMAFWALFNWVQSQDRKLLIVAALLTGLAMGVKHQGLATIFVGVLIVAGSSIARRRRPIDAIVDLVLFSCLAFAIVCPWYARSFAFAGNPVWPLANSLFDGLAFDTPPVVLSSTGEGALSAVVPTGDWIGRYWHSMSPWSWTFEPGGSQKWIGVFFVALLPGLALYAREKTHWLLVGFCAGYYLVLVKALHMNPRYGLVLFAFLSALCGCVAHRLMNSRWKAVPVGFAAAFFVACLLNITYAGYVLAKPKVAVALGLESRNHFLRRAEPNFRAFQYVNRNLHDGARILLQGIVKGYYCERSYMWDHGHQSYIDYDRLETPEDLLAYLKKEEITHVVRMIDIPEGRLSYFPQYFQDPYHEVFRKKYLVLVYRDERFAVFRVDYSTGTGNQQASVAEI